MLPKSRPIFKVSVIISLSLSLGAIIADQVLTDKVPEQGITRRTIRLGSILPLEGQEEALGNDMKAGLEAALLGEVIHRKRIELIFENDYYDPSIARQKTQKLIRSGIFLMIGSFGTSPAEQTLPILSEHNVPSVGFFTGAGLLRSNSESIINYRASYAQEIATVVRIALDAGVKPLEICAYVQNDGYGMAGLRGLKQALLQTEVPAEILRSYDRVLDRRSTTDNESNINYPNPGPIGIYTRNIPDVISGYQSLKEWEKKTGTTCKLVVTAGTYSNIARFVKFARDAGENWVISVLSASGARELQFDLEEYGVTEKIVMTQVVPLLDADFPIVKEARDKLGDDFGYVSLEGYIVGKMALKILREIPGQINRDNFLQQISVSKFDLGGIPIDFTRGRTHASDLVEMTVLTPQGFTGLDAAEFAAMFQ